MQKLHSLLDRASDLIDNKDIRKDLTRSAKLLEILQDQLAPLYQKLESLLVMKNLPLEAVKLKGSLIEHLFSPDILGPKTLERQFHAQESEIPPKDGFDTRHSEINILPEGCELAAFFLPPHFISYKKDGDVELNPRLSAQDLLHLDSLFDFCETRSYPIIIGHPPVTEKISPEPFLPPIFYKKPIQSRHAQRKLFADQAEPLPPLSSNRKEATPLPPIPGHSNKDKRSFFLL